MLGRIMGERGKFELLQDLIQRCGSAQQRILVLKSAVRTPPLLLRPCRVFRALA